MNKVHENYAYAALKRDLTQFDPNQAKVRNAQIKAKIDAALKAYPNWAKTQRSITPQQPTQAQPTQAQPTQAQPIQAQPTQAQLVQPKIQQTTTSLPNYAEKRAAAAQKAQADIQRGPLPPGDYNTKMADLLKRRQSQGMTESKFSKLYRLLESAIAEQEDDRGSFTEYLKNVIKMDFESNPEISVDAIKIDNLFKSNKPNEAYAVARNLLDKHYKQQYTSKSNGISSGISSASTENSRLNRIVQNIQSGILDQNDLNEIIMQSLIRLKTKFPENYSNIVSDIKGALRNFETSISQNVK